MTINNVSLRVRLILDNADCMAKKSRHQYIEFQDLSEALSKDRDEEQYKKSLQIKRCVNIMLKMTILSVPSLIGIFLKDRGIINLDNGSIWVLLITAFMCLSIACFYGIKAQIID